MWLGNSLSRIFRKKGAVQAYPVEASENTKEGPKVDTPIEPLERYRTDAPLDNEELDLFDRAPFANRVADTISTRIDPSSLVVAIYGPWGDGKTTVLNFICNRLRKYPSVIAVNFNPWRMDGEKALLQGFFETLADALDRELTTSSEKVGDVLKRYGALLKAVPGGWADAAQGAGEALSSVSIDELKERIGTLLREGNRLVVVVMDDIDRLEKSEIQAIFRLVKLTGDFQNTSYILAFDDQMVAAAIGERYATSTGNSYEAGTNFLEKIVQVPLHLPPAAPEELRKHCFSLVDEVLSQSGTRLDQNQGNEFVRHFVDGLEIRLKTPRMAKRYANALHFSLAILKEETYPPDLMLIEGMRVFFTKLYDAIRRNPETVLRTQSRDRGNSKLGEFIAAHTEGMSDEERKAAANLVEALFPRTRTTIFGRDWDTEFARDQRIASEYYFQRYFTYGIDRSDVPDALLNAFIASLSEKPVEELSTELGGMITERNAEKIIFKLRALEEKIEPTPAARLWVVIARNSSRYPNPKGFLRTFQTPLKQAAVHVSQLFRKIPPGLRGAQSLQVISEAETLQFACECARWLHKAPNSERERILTEADEIAMQTALGKRIEKHCSLLPAPIYVLEPDNAGLYLSTWSFCGELGGPRDYLTRHVTAAPESIFSLMKCFLGTAWAAATGLPIEADFERHSYDTMARLIDPEVVAQALLSIYGDQLNTPEFHLSSREPRETQACTSVHVHTETDIRRTESTISPCSSWKERSRRANTAKLNS